MTQEELKNTVLGKNINDVDADFGTCYPIVENGIIQDVVCSEFGSTHDGKKWKTDGYVAWFVSEEN